MDLCCVALNDSGTYQLRGEFSKFTIPENDRFIRPLFKANAPSILQLDAISSFDSALIALLISYKREYPSLTLSAPSLHLQKLLALYNVEEWFI